MIRRHITSHTIRLRVRVRAKNSCLFAGQKHEYSLMESWAGSVRAGRVFIETSGVDATSATVRLLMSLNKESEARRI